MKVPTQTHQYKNHWNRVFIPRNSLVQKWNQYQLFACKNQILRKSWILRFNWKRLRAKREFFTTLTSNAGGRLKNQPRPKDRHKRWTKVGVPWRAYTDPPARANARQGAEAQERQTGKTRRHFEAEDTTKTLWKLCGMEAARDIEAPDIYHKTMVCKHTTPNKSPETPKEPEEIRAFRSVTWEIFSATMHSFCRVSWVTTQC